VDEDQIRIEKMLYDRVCVVCGKAVDFEHASAHLKVGSEMITICCPMCYDIYQRDPDRFLALRAVRIAAKKAIGRRDAG
jgi:hypothetical protein